MKSHWTALVTLLLAASTAHAATFTVNSQADVYDDNPGDGTCHAYLGLPGVCTLRAAIQEANALPGADIIYLSAGQTYALTRSGLDQNASAGDLDITDSVSIIFFASGERPVVDANGQERAFEIHSGSVTLFGFDITGGDATVPGDVAGGAVAVNFGAGNVLLSVMRMYGNRANFGGALYNDGPATTLYASELYDNEHVSGFANSSSSAIRNRGTLTIDSSSIFANARSGGFNAIAVSNYPPNTGTPTLTVINSTIASNIGNGLLSADDSTLTLRNTTIAGNSGVGMQITGLDGEVFMRNSVIAHNGTADCAISTATSILNNNRYNMDSDDTCELSGGSSNYPATDPRLTPLAYRGGLTMVSWPLTDSPLIDLGHPVIGIIGCEDDDQHFLDRPVDFDGNGNARCDVGAIEMSDDVIFHDPIDRL